LLDILKGILNTIKDFHARGKLPHPEKNATNEECGPIQHPSFHRPDPLIYSQRYLQKLGLAVTWDNPDIVLRKDGVVVSEGDLLPNTDYEIDATIWNNSYDAPAVGLAVDFSFLSFGAGTTLHPIGNKVINLGVKGGINHPAHAKIIWTTPPVGHYCILVDLKWADDLNPENNLGQNNVNVVSAHSPATSKFQLMNNTRHEERFTFRVDTYTLPEKKECGEKISRPRNTRERWNEIQAIHDINKYPVPADWTVTVTPPEVPLLPDEEVEITVSITPPDSFVGEKAFNVNALYGQGRYAGGVTLYVSKPS
jgi:hypothetical protein